MYAVALQGVGPCVDVLPIIPSTWVCNCLVCSDRDLLDFGIACHSRSMSRRSCLMDLCPPRLNCSLEHWARSAKEPTVQAKANQRLHDFHHFPAVFNVKNHLKLC